MNKPPETYARDVVVNDQIVHIRAINASDTSIEKPTRALPKDLYNINYDTTMTFIAMIDNSAAVQQAIGVSHYTCDEYDHCLATLIVADDWQEHGLGQRLMKTLIDFAKTNHKELLYLCDLADNTYMRIVARDLGMNSQRDPNDAKIMRHELLL